jgi:hypothetical protein
MGRYDCWHYLTPPTHIVSLSLPVREKLIRGGANGAAVGAVLGHGLVRKVFHSILLRKRWCRVFHNLKSGSAVEHGWGLRADIYDKMRYVQ